ncbi:MAG: hypothetical protein ACR2PK_01635 [Acidimicrobiales bacterium]
MIAHPDAADSHEWVSFEHDGETWMFDVTFLVSNWSCIWNEGCLGVASEPDPEAGEGCCSFGAHFSDDNDRHRVQDAAARLSAGQWQNHQAPDVFKQGEDGSWRTVLVDGACVFLNRPGFDGGHGCALHRGAEEAGESHLTWKPEVCWQLPLRLEYHEDENGHTVATLRQWRRHDWGSGGDDFHWWCTEDDLAFVENTPVYQRLREELVAMAGEAVTTRLNEYLDRRGVEVFLPHPASRRASQT